MSERPLGLYRHRGHETILLKRQQDDYKMVMLDGPAFFQD
jgi:hypothetical protein